MYKIVIIGNSGAGFSSVQQLISEGNNEITVISKEGYPAYRRDWLVDFLSGNKKENELFLCQESFYKEHSINFFKSEASRLDTKKQRVILKDNTKINYDYLIIAIGSRHSYFGKDQWAKLAPGLKTVSDALFLREKILLSFEEAERINNDKEASKYITFVIVGGGPTGVELAGAIAEISKKALLKDFRNINPADAKIILVEALDRILTAYDPGLSNQAKRSLENLGVEVRLNTKVTDINEEGVSLNGNFLQTQNVIWAAGNQIPTLTKTLGAETDRAGRVIVEPDCSTKDHPEVFVIGDAALSLKNGKPLPGIAPVAIQQGKYVAGIIKRDINKQKRRPFQYFDKGNLATIGRARAIMESGRFKISGFAAWVAWVFIHILYLISYRNRYKVLSEWIWYYVTYKQGIRLITHDAELNRSRVQSAGQL